MAFYMPVSYQMNMAYKYIKFRARQKRMRTTDKVIADTVYGRVKGVKWQSLYGPTYYSFEGVPYAKPPVGPLRFRAPQEPNPWTGVKRCTRVRSKPCQLNIIMNRIQGAEDCLYLNVYTRQLPPTRTLPVLVWIYGGGFQMGEASRLLYAPDYFMMEDVVLVCVAYRVGPLGFLSFDDKELDIPGNAGLKDQALALKWVRRNCHFFGGNPDNITVFGESAGACSTHFLTLTEGTRGLFHKCVLMSGCAIAPWALIPKRDWAFRLAKAIGYHGPNCDRDILQFLQYCKGSAMAKVSMDLMTLTERQERLIFCFGPVIEPYDSEHCIIPRNPLQMMRQCWGNDIPMLIGGTSSEGLFIFTELRKYPEVFFNLGDAMYMTANDADLSDEQRREFGKLLKRTYFGDKEIDSQSTLHYSELCSYKYFWHGIHRTLLSRLHHATAPTYLYRFDFDSKHFNMMRTITCGRKVRGTCHGDDLSYMFYNAMVQKLKHRTAEYRTIRRLISILVNFAARGNPNFAINIANGVETTGDGLHHDDRASDAETLTIHSAPWVPLAKDDKVFKCLNISEDLEVIDLPEADKLQLWDSMYERKDLLY